MGEVERLHAEHEEPDVVKKTIEDDRTSPGVDVTFQTQIGEGRALSLRTMFPQNTPVEQQTAILTNVLLVADQQKARYELADLRWQLRLETRSLERCEDDLARLDETHTKRKAEIPIELDTLKGELSSLPDRFEKAYRASGRQGKFDLSPQQKREIEGIKIDLGKLEAERKNIDQQMGGERQNAMVALQRLRQNVNTHREEIEKRLMILGLPSEL